MFEKVFTDQGILGTLVVILGGVTVFLFRLVIQLQDKRLEDQKENSEKYRIAMGEFSRNNELLLAKLNGQKWGCMRFLFRLIPSLGKKERKIQSIKKDFHDAIDNDTASVRRVNKKLDNGLALRVYKAMVHHNGS